MSINTTQHPAALTRRVDLRDGQQWAEGGTIGLYSQGVLFSIYRDFLKEHVPSFASKYQLSNVPPPRPASSSDISISFEGASTQASADESKAKKKWRLGKSKALNQDVGRSPKPRGVRSRASKFFRRSWGSWGSWGNASLTAPAPSAASVSASSMTLSTTNEEVALSKVPLKIDGFLVYVVPDEEPGDLENFLTALVKPSTFPKDEVVSYDVLFSVLLLSTKYDVIELRRVAISHIMSTYPPSLQRFLERGETRTLPSKQGALFALLALNASYRRQAQSQPEQYHVKYPHLVPPVILPVLLYCCTTYEVEDLVNGVEYEGQKVHLAPEDLRKCLIGGSKLLAITEDVYDFLKEDYVEGCQWVRRYRNNREPRNIGYYKENPCALGRLKALSIRPLNDSDVFDDDEKWWEAFEQEVCEVCQRRADEAFVTARKEAWDILPRILQMEDDWETLSKISEKEFMRAREEAAAIEESDQSEED